MLPQYTVYNNNNSTDSLQKRKYIFRIRNISLIRKYIFNDYSIKYQLMKPVQNNMRIKD